MREVCIYELELVSGGGNAIDTMNATIAGSAAGAIGLSTLRGVAIGSRVGIVGAVVGGAVGLAAGVYDWYQDGSEYGSSDGTDY